MVVKHKLEMDLAKPAEMPRVDTVHKDQYTRQLELALYANEEPWEIPEDVDILISFIRTDGSGGSYDTLPTGAQAWSAEGNVLTIELAPDVLATPGPAMMAVDLIQGSSKISTFTIMLYIRETILTRVGSSEDYINITSFLPMPDTAEVGQYFRVSQVDESGGIEKLEAVTLPSLDTAVQEALSLAKDSGEFDGASAYEVAVQNGFEGTEDEWVASLNRPASGSWEEVVAQSILVTGALTADSGITVNLYGNRIQGVSDPKNEKDAANKRYVDQSVNPYAIPDYWQDAVNEAISTIKANQDEGGKNCVTIANFGNCHFNPNDQTVNPCHTGKLVAAVMDACNIPFAIMTGNAVRIDSDTMTEEEMEENLKFAEEVLKPIGWDRLIQLQGTYDGTYGADFAYQMDSNALYGAIYRKQALDTRRVFGGDGTYFYIDYLPAKVRIIVLNSCWVEDGTDEEGYPLHNRKANPGYGQTQLDWFANTALRFEEEGWGVILYGHHGPTSSKVREQYFVHRIIYSFMNKKNMVETFTEEQRIYGTEGEWDYVCLDADFTEAVSADIICAVLGEKYADTVIRQFMWGYWIVGPTPDGDVSTSTTEEDRVLGTANEHAIDFCTINRSTRKARFTRLGVGSNRGYGY